MIVTSNCNVVLSYPIFNCTRPSTEDFDCIDKCIPVLESKCWLYRPLVDLTLNDLAFKCKSEDPGEVMRTLGLSR